MIFHENRLLADNSHETSYLFLFRKLGKVSQNLSSAAVVRLKLFIYFRLTSDFISSAFINCHPFLPFLQFASIVDS